MNTDFFGNSRYKGGHGEYVQGSGGYILLPLHPLQQNGALPLFSCVSAVGLTAVIYSIWSQGPLTWRGGGTLSGLLLFLEDQLQPQRPGLNPVWLSSFSVLHFRCCD